MSRTTSTTSSMSRRSPGSTMSASRPTSMAAAWSPAGATRPRPAMSPPSCVPEASARPTSRRYGAATCCGCGRPSRQRPAMTDRLRRGAFLAALLAFQAMPSEAVTPDVAAIDAAIRATVERYDLPGIAVGIVADGEVAHVRTIGETVAGSGDPVTTDTLFKIASNSKAMTATVLARLVQAGKLRWDDPVVKHLPHFAMHDPWVTEHMTVHDLLVHNSGLPEGGGDLMLWPEPNDFTRMDITRGLRHIVPAYGFRAGYAYDNLLYVVAGEVAAAAGGASYEELVRREIFEPLALDGCRVGEFDRGRLSVAQPHWHDGTRNIAYRIDPPLVPAIASAAAGGIRC